jgi:hypothetical protein
MPFFIANALNLYYFRGANLSIFYKPTIVLIYIFKDLLQIDSEHHFHRKML